MVDQRPKLVECCTWDGYGHNECFDDDLIVENLRFVHAIDITKLEALFAKFRQKHPEAVQVIMTIQEHAYAECDDKVILLHGLRRETPEETAARVDREIKAEQVAAAYKLEQERKLYEKLKKKFEGENNG